MNHGVYYIFITALISSYEDMIIAALVKNGFMVSSLSEDNEVTMGGGDYISAIIALRIDIEDEVKPAIVLSDEIEKVLKDLNIVYYSLIVTESTDCSWNVSDIKIPKALPALPPPKLNVRKPGTGWN
jgi:hypothetical protein